MGPLAHHRLQAVNTRGEVAETMKDEIETAEMMGVLQEDAAALEASKTYVPYFQFSIYPGN